MFALASAAKVDGRPRFRFYERLGLLPFTVSFVGNVPASRSPQTL